MATNQINYNYTNGSGQSISVVGYKSGVDILISNVIKSDKTVSFPLESKVGGTVSVEELEAFATENSWKLITTDFNTQAGTVVERAADPIDVTFEVLDQNGDPIQYANVRLINPTTGVSEFNGLTDSDGIVEYNEVAPGDYLLLPERIGKGDYVYGGDEQSNGIALRVGVYPDEIGGTSMDRTITMKPAYMLRLTVVNEVGGTPIEGVQAYVWDSRSQIAEEMSIPEKKQVNPGLTTSTTGTASVMLSPGAYIVNCRVPGFDDISVGPITISNANVPLTIEMSKLK